MTILPQVMLSGLLLGSLYSLISVGISLIYGTMKVVNFAHGEFMMIAMYIAFWLFSFLNFDPLISLLVIFPGLFLFGSFVQRLLVFRVLRYEVFAQVLLTLGLLLFIQNFALLAWTADFRSVITSYQDVVLLVGHLRLEFPRLLAAIVALGLNGILHLFLTRTWTGTAIRATAQDREAAEALGINTKGMYSIAFGLGIAMAGMAGGLMATFFPVYPAIGTSFTMIGLVVVVLGGLGNYPGAVAAGLIIGAAEAMAAFAFVPVLRQAIAFLVFVAVLLLRPQGLFERALRR